MNRLGWEFRAPQQLLPAERPHQREAIVTTDTTWAERLNGALDQIIILTNDRNDALDAISDFLREHPEHDSDLDLARARIALL